MQRYSILLISLIAILLPDVTHAGKQGKPNIIFIIADDMHRHMFNSLPEGKGKNLTPNIDLLAAEGTLMMGQYVSAPVCTPSRYSCLTGLYASRTKCKSFQRELKRSHQSVVQWNCHITDELTLPKLLQQAGYKTGFVGKNHVIKSNVAKVDYDANPRDPTVAKQLQERQHIIEKTILSAGFDYAASLYEDNPDGNGPRELAVHNLDWTTDGALKFIDANAKQAKPFFLYYATTIPHGPGESKRSWNANPLAIPTGYLDKPLDVLPPRHTIPKRLKQAGIRQTAVRENTLWLDDSVGAILARIRKLGIDDNTIVVFFNDHGQAAKGTLYQGGVTNPSIIWRKGGFPCGQINKSLVSNIDFAPTLLEMAGVQYSLHQFDGKSFLPVLQGKVDQIHKSLYFEMGYSKAVVKENWKYIALRYPKHAQQMSLEQRTKILKNFNAKQRKKGRPIHSTDPKARFSHISLIPGGGDAEAVSTGKRAGYYDADQLYNLTKDPQEQTNLAGNPEYAKKLKEMKNLLQKHLSTLPGKFAELKTTTKPIGDHRK